jgi:excisionase family DNA binding protein
MRSSEKLEVSAIEAARKLGVGLDYLYSLLWTGKLAGRKVGRQWRIPIEAVEVRLKQRGA